MYTLIDAAFARYRTVLLLLFMLIVGGISAFQNIPKEAEPDVPIPVIYVSVVHQGISPDDAERLIIRPLETELQSLEGLKEMTAIASEGHASVSLEFEAGIDNKQALLDVREQVDLARAELPTESEEPLVSEVNVALFPVISLILAGDVPEPQLMRMAQTLQDDIETLPGVLKADIQGEREDLLEIRVDPAIIETYGIDLPQVLQFVSNNNELVAAGAVDSGAGRLVVKVPGVLETFDDILNLPIVVNENRVTLFRDVAEIRPTYKDATSFIRLNGRPALAIDVTKRLGANIIETIEDVRRVAEDARQNWPETVRIHYMQDKSNEVRDMLWDLQNNVLSAIVLVMLVIIIALGVRASMLVGLAIPGSFFAGMLVLYLMGFSTNIVVLFSLILVVGMLVDGAIVVSELAERHLAEGDTPPVAYAKASKRMSWPIIGSTITTLVVFIPLLFWPGMIGKFMQYLPITVLITLTASLFMALIFMPVVGGLFPAPSKSELKQKDIFAPLTRQYEKQLERVLRYPMRTIVLMVLILFGSILTYGIFGKGVEFFPDTDSDYVQMTVRSRGDFAALERDAIMKQVEAKLEGLEEVKSIYGRTGVGAGHGQASEDVLGTIFLELVNWKQRRIANEVMVDIRKRTEDIPGVVIEVFKQAGGPGGEKPVQIEVSAGSPEMTAKAADILINAMQAQGTFIDIEDTRPLPGIEWALEVNRELAAQNGVDVLLIGQTLQMATHGLLIDNYRPDYSTDDVDIRLRFPPETKHIDTLLAVRVPTHNGPMPLANFVTTKPQQKVSNLYRTDGKRVVRVKADVAEGKLLDTELKTLQQTLAPQLQDAMALDPQLRLHIKGEQADQKEAGDFLSAAFQIAVFSMLLILVTQFNSMYQALVVLSAIVFSTAGVFLGLLITGKPFGVVMCGIALIALAGIVVNNNIVLIDTFNELKAKYPTKEAILETGKLRLRPVLLTAITTVLGLMPMVFSLNIDFIQREINYGAPSTLWWVQLSTSIAGGLVFATILTLFLTPALLMMGDIVAQREPLKRLKIKVKSKLKPKLNE